MKRILRHLTIPKEFLYPVTYVILRRICLWSCRIAITSGYESDGIGSAPVSAEMLVELVNLLSENTRRGR